MPDKLTDSEIIKALNTALGMKHISIYCANIKNEVQTIRALDIIDLINRLKAENERLCKFLNMSRKVSLARRDENIRKDKLMIKMSAELKTAKSEAVTEFAYELKQIPHSVVRKSEIDNLLKAKVGEKK